MIALSYDLISKVCNGSGGEKTQFVLEKANFHPEEKLFYYDCFILIQTTVR